MLDIWHILLILVVGAISGFINTCAGGGSLLSLPLLIFLGLPSTVANGTNRIGILVQNASAMYGFVRKGIHSFRISIPFIFPTLLGAWLGAYWGTYISDAIFQKVLAITMVFVLATIVYFPQRDSNNRHISISRIFSSIAFFFVGLYGGFIQIGVGFLIISVLLWIGGFSLIEIHSIKVNIIFFYTIIALATYASANKIDWVVGAILAIGNGLGAWIATQWAIDKGEEWMRKILVVMVVLFAVKLLFT